MFVKSLSWQIDPVFSMKWHENDVATPGVAHVAAVAAEEAAVQLGAEDVVD